MLTCPGSLSYLLLFKDLSLSLVTLVCAFKMSDSPNFTFKWNRLVFPKGVSGDYKMSQLHFDIQRVSTELWKGKEEKPEVVL